MIQEKCTTEQPLGLLCFFMAVLLNRVLELCFIGVSCLLVMFEELIDVFHVSLLDRNEYQAEPRSC